MPTLNDGFDDDFDEMPAAAPADDGFDDDFGAENAAPGGFDDDFDDAPAAQDDGFDDGFDEQPAPAPAPKKAPAQTEEYRKPDENVRNIDEPMDTEWAPVNNDLPPHKARTFFLVLGVLVILFGSAWCTGYFKNGFMPKDMLRWKVFGGASLSDMFHLHDAEELVHSDEGMIPPEEKDEPEKELTDADRYPGLLVTENATYCVVTGYTGKEKSITLPATYNGKKCTRIADNAFSSLSVTDIEIPEGYEMIGQSAFADCSITDLKLPSTVTAIGWGMCSGCRGLESVTLPDGIEKIEDWAFASCPKLNNFVMPDSVTVVGEWAFNACVSMTDITLSKNLQAINGCGFYDCRSLDAMELPDGLLSIGDMAFRSCHGLLVIQIPDSVTVIGTKVFMNCNENLLIVGSEGSKAQSYAKQYDLQFSTP